MTQHDIYNIDLDIWNKVFFGILCFNTYRVKCDLWSPNKCDNILSDNASVKNLQKLLIGSIERNPDFNLK